MVVFAVKRLFFILILFLIAAGAGLYIDWNWKRPLWPRGGRYFFHRVELPVPSFRQSDERWSDDPLGGVPDNGTLGGEGCIGADFATGFGFAFISPKSIQDGSFGRQLLRLWQGAFTGERSIPQGVAIESCSC